MKFMLSILLCVFAFFTVDMGAAGMTIQHAAAGGGHLWHYVGFGVFFGMATLATTHPTLLDLAQVMGPDDKIARIIEILNDTNEILDDAVAVEGNELTGHVTTVRTGIPAPTWRKLYGGVQPTKSTSVKIKDSCGMLENYAEVDKALADLNGNSAAFRLSENKPILEGFNQEVADSLFYANENTEPEAFTGFGPRFNAISGAENGQNIIDGGGVAGQTDCTSIWLIVWSQETAHLIYPKGSKAGFFMEDKGQVTIENVDGAGGRMEAYRTHYRWDIGLTVRDWRYVVRIANIDISTLTKTGSTGSDLVDLMTQALEAVENVNVGRAAFYCNRKVRSYLRRQMVNKTVNSTLSLETMAGKRVMVFDGVPVRRSDAILQNESVIA